jgi:hypothetical protein
MPKKRNGKGGPLSVGDILTALKSAGEKDYSTALLVIEAWKKGVHREHYNQEDWDGPSLPMPTIAEVATLADTLRSWIVRAELPVEGVLVPLRKFSRKHATWMRHLLTLQGQPASTPEYWLDARSAADAALNDVKEHLRARVKPATSDDVKHMRQIIAKTPGGQKAASKKLVKNSGIGASRAYAALRKLEKAGEYQGFTKPPRRRPSPL